MNVAIEWVFWRGEVTPFVVTYVIFGVMTSSKGHTCWLSFNRYCLLVGPKAKLVDIESAYFALIGSRDVRYGQLGSSRVEFCSF